MTLGLVRTTAWVRVTATSGRVAGRRTTRMTATTGVRVPTGRVRMPTARVRMAATGARVPASADVTARVWGASARISVGRTAARVAVRRAAAGVTTIVMRDRMSAARGTVVLAAGVTVRRTAAGVATVVMRDRVFTARGTVIFGSVAARGTVMCYFVRRATVRLASVRTNNTPAGELTRSRRCGHSGSAVIKRRAQLSIPCGGVLVVTLQRRGLEMMLVFCRQLMRSGTCLDAARAIERHVDVVVDDGMVIYVGDVDTAHIHDRAVIKVGTAAPVTALESNTAITEAVIHTAVEADMRAPVATVPGVDATAPTPVPGRPQHPGRRRQHPRARHPEITVITIGPIAWCPHIARRRQLRLDVYGKDRGRDVNRNAYRNTGVRNRREHGERGER
jgi:hypothetical protein